MTDRASHLSQQELAGLRERIETLESQLLSLQKSVAVLNQYIGFAREALEKSEAYELHLRRKPVLRPQPGRGAYKVSASKLLLRKPVEQTKVVLQPDSEQPSSGRDLQTRY